MFVCSHRHSLQIVYSFATAMSLTLVDANAAHAQHYLPGHRECIVSVNGLVEQLFSGNVREGNRGLDRLTVLFTRLDQRAEKARWDPRVAFSKKRAYMWGRIGISPRAAGEDLLCLIDVPLPDYIDTGSLVNIGDSHSVLHDLQNRGIRGLSPLLASYPNDEDASAKTQELFVGATIGTVFRGSPQAMDAYLARFDRRATFDRDKMALSRVEEHAKQWVKSKRFAEPKSRAKAEIEVRWNSRKATVGCEFPAPPLRRYATTGDSDVERLAEKIFSLSDIGPDGNLGLFQAVVEKASQNLNSAVEKDHLLGFPITEQLQKVKRAILMLAMLHDSQVADILVRHMEEQLVLDDPDGDEPFRDIAFVDLCAEYGDGIIDPVARRVGSDSVMDGNRIDSFAQLLLRACGNSPEDREFLRAYITEKYLQTGRHDSLFQLVQRIAKLE